jgi:uncharacterized protein (TIGR03000 family)
MSRQVFSVIAGLLAAAAFALSPGTAAAQHHGGGGHGGGGHGGGGWHGGTAWHGGGWHDGGWHGGYYGHRGWGVGIGVSYPWYGYGGYWPGSYGYSYSPYYYSNNVYYDTSPYAADASYYYGATPAYSGVTSPGYAYGTTAPSAPTQDNTARVRVVVPDNARVWFNESATNQSGRVREFESPPLQPGRDYTYEVKAQWRDPDGNVVTRTRHVDVTANDSTTVDFTR